MKKAVIIIIFFSTLLSYSQENNSSIKIKTNYKRINKITNWQDIKKAALTDSLEGGEALFYYSDSGIEKITAKYYGETGKRIIEYYFLNKQLSFSYDVITEYNNHISSENFTEDNAVLTEIRSYFNNDKLIKQLRNKKDKFDLQEEALRIKSDLISILLQLK